MSRTLCTMFCESCGENLMPRALVDGEEAAKLAHAFHHQKRAAAAQQKLAEIVERWKATLPTELLEAHKALGAGEGPSRIRSTYMSF